jgi:NAD(P)H-hydrate epimerase
MGPGWTTEDSAGDFLRKMLDHDNVEARRRPKRSIGFSLAADTDGDDGEDEDTGVVLPPLVIDADGINLLAKMDLWWELLPENTILTPHPGEMARLCDVETSDVQNQRWELVQEKSAAWNAVIVLKGAHTLVAEPGGRVAAIPFKTDALATAGSGDVLAGLIAGLRAQGMDAFAAAVCGAYIHGLAGVIAGRQLGAGRSVIAGDVLNAIAAAFQAILRG